LGAGVKGLGSNPTFQIFDLDRAMRGYGLV